MKIASIHACWNYSARWEMQKLVYLMYTQAHSHWHLRVHLIKWILSVSVAIFHRRTTHIFSFPTYVWIRTLIFNDNDNDNELTSLNVVKLRLIWNIESLSLTMNCHFDVATKWETEDEINFLIYMNCCGVPLSFAVGVRVFVWLQVLSHSSME